MSQPMPTSTSITNTPPTCSVLPSASTPSIPSHSSHSSQAFSASQSPSSQVSLSSSLPPSSTPQAAIHNPQSLQSHGLALFHTILSLLCAVLSTFIRQYAAAPKVPSTKVLAKAAEVMKLLVSVELTLDFAPQRITPLQLHHLSAAASALSRLTGRAFDFSPWLALTPAELSAFESPSPSPSQSSDSSAPATPISIHYPRPTMRSAYPVPRNPQPSIRNPKSTIRNHRCPHHSLIRNPQSEIRNRYASALRASRSRFPHLLPNPGATLARAIQKLARLLPPDFSPNSIPSMHNPKSAIRNPQSSDARFAVYSELTDLIPVMINRVVQSWAPYPPRPTPPPAAKSPPT